MSNSAELGRFKMFHEPRKSFEGYRVLWRPDPILKNQHILESMGHRPVFGQ